MQVCACLNMSQVHVENCFGTLTESQKCTGSVCMLAVLRQRGGFTGNTPELTSGYVYFLVLCWLPLLLLRRFA